MQALDILGLDYESEYTDLEYSVDLALPNERIAIEVRLASSIRIMLLHYSGWVASRCAIRCCAWIEVDT